MSTNLLDRFNEDLKKKQQHSPYSPDLAPSDYFLFQKLKKWLGGKRFYSNDEIISQTNTYFEDLEKSYFLEGMQKLEKLWTKCIELRGDYIEKLLFIKKPLFDLKSHALIDPPSYIDKYYWVFTCMLVYNNSGNHCNANKFHYAQKCPLSRRHNHQLTLITMQIKLSVGSNTLCLF